MAIKNIVAKGIGFAPAGVRWVVTHGFLGAAQPTVGEGLEYVTMENRLHYVTATRAAHYTFVRKHRLHYEAVQGRHN